MKILLDNHHGVGDVAMFISVLNSVKKYFPDSEIQMLVKSKVEQELVEIVGGVSNFYYYDPVNHSLKSLLKLIYELRKNHYDLGICHIGTNRRSGAILMKLINCKKSIGSSTGKHIIDYNIPINTTTEYFRSRKNALLLNGIGINEVQEYSLLTSVEFIGNIKKIISSKFINETVIGVCIGTGNTIVNGIEISAKKWPDNYWIELIYKFLNCGYKIIILGGKKEKNERDKKFDDLPSESIIDFTGQLKLSESIEAISACDLLLAADTGLGFCAALMDIPTISLLGPSDPAMAAPYGKYAHYIFLGLPCSPCYGTKEMLQCKDRKCLKQITVNMVFEKSKEILEEGFKNECRNT